jgi:uncharacterized protein (TIGR03083 family)
MDHLPHYRREVAAFTDAARRVVGAMAPLVPSCPGWSASDLVAHLGRVHRMLAPVIRDRMTERPAADRPVAPGSPGDKPPTVEPVPAALVDWFAEGAEVLGSLFAARRPDEPAWSWSADHTVGFWLRMQTIEAAVHRWDLENAVGGPVSPLDQALARDAVSQTFQVLAPARRSWQPVPDGSGETFRFRQTDGPSDWTIRFDGPAVRWTDDSPADVTLSGTASNLTLFLWHRITPAECGDIDGDPAALARYFQLVPPT